MSDIPPDVDEEWPDPTDPPDHEPSHVIPEPDPDREDDFD